MGRTMTLAMSEIPQAQHEDQIPQEQEQSQPQIGGVVNSEIPESDERAGGGKSTPSWRAAKGKWVTGREADGSLIIRGGKEKPAANTQIIGILKGASVYENLFRADDGSIKIEQVLRVFIETAFGEEVARFPLKNTTSASIAINSLKQFSIGDRIAITLRTSFNSSSIEITYPGFSIYRGGWGAEPEQVKTENKGKGKTQEEARKAMFEDAKELRKSPIWLPQECGIKAVSGAAHTMGWDEDIESRYADYAACFAKTYKADNILDLNNGHHLYRLTRMIAGWQGSPGVLKSVVRPADQFEDDPFADE